MRHAKDVPGGTAIRVGPWAAWSDDPIVPDLQAAAALILPDGDARAIWDGDLVGPNMYSAPKPAGAQSWAWGFTPADRRCWINPDRPANDRRYVAVHEWAHSIEDRFFNHSVHRAILDYLGVTTGWNEGVYDAHLCTVPRESYADHFARAMTGNHFRGILPDFYQPAIKPADYGWLLRVVAEAMGIQ